MQVGSVDLLDERGALQVHEGTHIAGHVARGGDPRVELAVEDELRPRAVGHGGHVGMRLDEPRDREPIARIDDLGTLPQFFAELTGGHDGADRLSLHHDGHVGPRRCAGSVDHGGALEDGPGRRIGALARPGLGL